MKKKLILAVDDDPLVRRLIRSTLDDGSCTLIEAGQALDGLQLALATPPDILLLDIGLPDQLDGFSLCATLRDDPRFAHTRVVVITGFDGPEDIALARRLGAAAYIVKPFSPDALRKLVRNLDTAGGDMQVIAGQPVSQST
jgi:CheY-like chemotaxis protein